MDGYQTQKNGVIKDFFFSSLKVGLVCLLLAGCVDIPTDGFETETGNLLPSVSILSPPKIPDLGLQADSTEILGSNLFLEGSEILFAGIGFDPEDDSLSAASLQWTSDKDGELGTGTTLAKSDLSSGTHWIFLTATDSQGGTDRDSVQITVGEATDALPLAPSDLLAAVQSATSVLLSWADNSDNEAHFVIEQRLGGLDTDFALGTIVEKNTTSAEITGLEPGTLYEFRVYAENTSGSSEPSNIAEVTTPLGDTLEETLELLAPSNLQALAQSSTSILLNWVDNSDNETHFIVEERIAGLDADFAYSNMVAENDTSVEVTGLEADTPYEFRVYAYEENSNSVSDYSNIAEETILTKLTKIVSADNTLDESNPDLVVGEDLISVGLELLNINLDLETDTVEYYAALQLEGLGEYISGRTIGEATLLLYYVGSEELQLETETVFAVNPFLGQWNPKEITWNNQPKYDEQEQSIYRTSLLTPDEAIKFDVTSVVQKWADNDLSNNGLVVRIEPDLISDLVSIVAKFNSLEEATDEKYQPQLYIKFKD